MIRDPSNMADWTDVESIRPAEEPASAIDQKLCESLEAWPTSTSSDGSVHAKDVSKKSSSVETKPGVVDAKEFSQQNSSKNHAQSSATRLQLDRKVEVGAAPTHGSNWNWDRGIAGALHLGVSSPVARESAPAVESSSSPDNIEQPESSNVKYFIPDSLIVTDPVEEPEGEMHPSSAKPASDIADAAEKSTVEQPGALAESVNVAIPETEGQFEIPASAATDVANEPKVDSVNSVKQDSVLVEAAAGPAEATVGAADSSGDNNEFRSVRSEEEKIIADSGVDSSPANDDEHEIDVIQSQDLEVLEAEDVVESEESTVESKEAEVPSSTETPPPLQRTSPVSLDSDETSPEEIAGEDILEEEDWEEVAVEEVAVASVPPALNTKHGNNGGEYAPAPVAAPPPLRSPEQRVHRSWHIDAFEDYFSALSSADSMESAAKDAKFIDNCLGSPTSATLLDVACGDGRHSFAFADLGYQVTGMDNSAAQLRRAASHNEVRTHQVRFVSADMRSIPDATSYDIVLCLGSSLGYFDIDQNRMVLERMNGVLRPGGRMILQVFNRDSYVSRLPCRSWWGGKGCLVLDEVDFDFLSEQLIVNRTVVFEDGQQVEKRIAIHAYTLQELLASVEKLGLQVREVSGSRYTRGCFYGAASPDIWLIAEKNNL